MNILFLTSAAPKKSPIPTSEKRPPLGVGYLMAVLKKEGHSIFFSDEYLKPTSILDGNFLSRNNIDFVGIYSNSICYQATLSMFEKLQRKRENGEWNGKIMVGGPHTAFGYNEIPEYVDFIVIGEGEITVPKIINGEISSRIVRGEKVKELDSLPFPAWEEFIHLPYMWFDERIEGMPLYTFNTSRGCPYSCTFCSVKGVWGQNYRYMSAERVVKDIEYMVHVYGLKAAFFREDHFTLNQNRTAEICESLIKKDIKINWMCESRADSIDDPNLMKLMARSGCRALYIGVESGSPRMLEYFKKGETVDQFIRVFDYAKKYGINTHGSFVMEAPGEREEDRVLTEKLIERIKPDTVRRNVFIGLPGSELTEVAKKENLIEFTDKNGISYLKGYHKNIEKYYNGNEEYKIYDPTTYETELSFNYFKEIKQIESIKGKSNINEKLLEKQYLLNKKDALLEGFLYEFILRVYENSKRIALYGGGTHTILFLSILKKAAYKLPIVVFDREPEKTLIKDITVDTIENINKYGLDILIISNDRQHYEIYNELLYNESLKNIEIVDPYLYLPHAPYRK